MNINWLNEYSQEFLERGYLEKGQSVENRIQMIGDRSEKILKEMCVDEEDKIKFDGFSLKIQSYISKGWLSLSTPIWANFGGDKNLPISCFNSHISDSLNDIMGSATEVAIMSKYGGGTSGYFGELRGRGSIISKGGFSTGTKSFLELFQSVSNTVNQSAARRGYFAGYIDIFHSDIKEWLSIRGEGDPIQHLTWGVCVPDWWLNEMKEGDKEKRDIWALVIKKRFETGMPYLFFNDNANNGESVPEVYKGKNLIKSSNLCNEIYLPSNENESFVCNLSSVNDIYYDDYKNTSFIKDVVFFLDSVMEEFITMASKIKHFEKAVNFAKQHRALGIGRLGYHSMLQSKLIPFESLLARNINSEIQKYIKEQTYEASRELFIMFGAPDALTGYQRRNTTLTTLPPTTSSAFILGQISQSIEPLMSNFMIKDLAKGKYIIKNKYLEEVLENIGKNTKEVWDSIMEQHGSVLHLNFLDDNIKSVFKTAREINQKEIIIQASQRQKYIDQGQSLNIFINAETTAKEVNELMLLAHKLGIKGLYYQHNFSAASEFVKNFKNCTSCE